jgi:hypothetical protein
MKKTKEPYKYAHLLKRGFKREYPELSVAKRLDLALTLLREECHTNDILLELLERKDKKINSIETKSAPTLIKTQMSQLGTVIASEIRDEILREEAQKWQELADARQKTIAAQQDTIIRATLFASNVAKSIKTPDYLRQEATKFLNIKQPYQPQNPHRKC